MKKFMLAAGLLAMFNVAMAYVGGEVEVKEGDINVSAYVVDPLSLSLRNVEFGVIPSNGDVKTNPETEGLISITGTGDARVKVSMRANGIDYPVGSQGDTIKLYNNGNDSVTYVPKFYVEGNLLTTDTIQLLNGQREIDVKGEAYVNAPNDIATGRYSTDLNIRVQYDY